MFDLIGIEVTDLERSARFYDPLMFALGGRRMFEGPGAIAYGMDRAQLWLVARGRGVDGKASFGHIALKAPRKAAVDAAFAAAVANGGRGGGAPRPRAPNRPPHHPPPNPRPG